MGRHIEGTKTRICATLVAAVALAAGSARAGDSREMLCVLAVDGVVHVAGPCDVFPLGGGTYTLNVKTGDGGDAERAPHFAQVTGLADGSYAASWNADPTDDRAGDDLGPVTLTNGCWINDRARICVGELQR